MNLISQNFKSAFIALVGRPNCGKSTLLNTLLGESLAVVSALPQTTRKNMKGIYTEDGFQLIFVDTPGMHSGKHALNKLMYEQSFSMFKDTGIDIICYLVDLSRDFGKEEDQIANMVIHYNKISCIIFNKVDLCKNVESMINNFFTKFPKLKDRPTTILTATSEEAKGLFLKIVKPLLTEGPQYYPNDDLTDKNLRYFASEYIRNRIIEVTRQEVPHAACVEIIDYKESPKRHTIEAVIHVETQGQKGIIVGKKGMVINQIKKRSQIELAKLVGLPVTIKCHVKVTPKWRDNRNFLNEMGFI